MSDNVSNKNVKIIITSMASYTKQELDNHSFFRVTLVNSVVII